MLRNERIRGEFGIFQIRLRHMSSAPIHARYRDPTLMVPWTVLEEKSKKRKAVEHPTSGSQTALLVEVWRPCVRGIWSLFLPSARSRPKVCVMRPVVSG